MIRPLGGGGPEAAPCRWSGVATTQLREAKPEQPDAEQGEACRLRHRISHGRKRKDQIIVVEVATMGRVEVLKPDEKDRTDKGRDCGIGVSRERHAEVSGARPDVRLR